MIALYFIYFSSFYYRFAMTPLEKSFCFVRREGKSSASGSVTQTSLPFHDNIALSGAE